MYNITKSDERIYENVLPCRQNRSALVIQTCKPAPYLYCICIVFEKKDCLTIWYFYQSCIWIQIRCQDCIGIEHLQSLCNTTYFRWTECMLTKFMWALCILLESFVCRMYGKKILAFTLHRLAILLSELHRVAIHVAIIQCIYKYRRHLRWGGVTTSWCYLWERVQSRIQIDHLHSS